MNFELTEKWFAGNTPVNADFAVTTLGDGDNKEITVTADNIGVEGNDYIIEIVVPDEAKQDLIAICDNKVITIFLATTDTTPIVTDDTKNTAKDIADAINSLECGVTAKADGTGAGVFDDDEEDEYEFEGGQYCTIAPIPYTMYFYNDYYYVNIVPCNKYSTGWKKFTLVNL